MTEKQENILNAALELFATDGYNAVSTSRIAKKAGVSEGLIFRHFGNKEGLLNAIMDIGRAEAFKAYAKIFRLAEPKQIIKATIELPVNAGADGRRFWRLIYALKWQRKEYDNSFTLPLRQALTNAFEELNYTNPADEADIVLMLMDGIAMSVLLREVPNLKGITQAIFTRYDL